MELFLLTPNLEEIVLSAQFLCSLTTINMAGTTRH